ncbi:MAG: YihY/virulence factor BrkB family protein [Steroidobacteraceae bacterium]|jgi:membrane protein|nr:YihY/virulence factor BrkB family protein [Steroidobacteraceae bacterium]
MDQDLLNLRKRVEAHLFAPREASLRRPADLAIAMLRYPYALARDLVKGDINLRAMSLVYTTLLAIVPLIAFAFALLKGFGILEEDQLEPVVYTFLEPIGAGADELTLRIVEFVGNVRGDVVGALGFLFLLWTVIGVIQKVEEALNFIWHVERVRSFARRFSEYLSVMVVGPALMVTALGLIASLTSNDVVHWLASHEPFGTVLVMLGKLGPLVLVAASLAFLYSFIPNTRVRGVAAVAAGLVAGAAWVAAGFAFTQLVASSSRMMAIYASFAILLLALMWLWLNWLILLLGAQLAFYLQNPQYLRSGQREVQATARLRERLALSVMYLVARDFETGARRWTLNDLSTELAVPSGALGPVVATLERARLLESTEKEAFVPGRDPAQIGLDAILDAVRDGRSGNTAMIRRARTVAAADAACDRVESAIRECLQRTSLKEFVAQAGPTGVAPSPAAADAHGGDPRVTELRRDATR